MAFAEIPFNKHLLVYFTLTIETEDSQASGPDPEEPHTEVPEPSTLVAIFALGIMVIGLRRIENQ